ncbi:Fibronectin [Manis pentadactyla]|nr:Fibronectin [Manis pentadactyla]
MPGMEFLQDKEIEDGGIMNTYYFFLTIVSSPISMPTSLHLKGVKEQYFHIITTGISCIIFTISSTSCITTIITFIITITTITASISCTITITTITFNITIITVATTIITHITTTITTSITTCITCITTIITIITTTVVIFFLLSDSLLRYFAISLHTSLLL